MKAEATVAIRVRISTETEMPHVEEPTRREGDHRIEPEDHAAYLKHQDDVLAHREELSRRAEKVITDRIHGALAEVGDVVEVVVEEITEAE